MSNLDTALSLARAGFYVFPMTSSGRFLQGFGWDRGASRSLNQIRGWWANSPRQRIGVHCGRSGLVVVDLDRKNGKDGVASLKKAGLDLSRTFNYTSRSGNGEHHIYRAPEGEQLTIDRDLNGMPGVDIRSGIGLIVYNGPTLTKKPGWHRLLSGRLSTKRTVGTTTWPTWRRGWAERAHPPTRSRR
jgi:hypothetical protein